MLDSKSLEEFVQKISEVVPPAFRQAQSDFDKTLHSVLISAFGKLNLVTREEFEINQTLLKRTREKLDELTEHVQQLEAKLNEGQVPATKATTE